MSVDVPDGAMYAFVRFELPDDSLVSVAALNAEDRDATMPSAIRTIVWRFSKKQEICVVTGSGFGQEPGLFISGPRFCRQKDRLLRLWSGSEHFTNGIHRTC